MPAAQKPSNSLIDDQENSLISGNSKFSKIPPGKLLDGDGKGNVLDSPMTGAKTILNTKRVVLADKTPNNIKRPLQSIQTNSHQKTAALSSPIKNSNITSPTLLTHPSLRDIATITKTLTNPPDLFLQPKQKRRSIRNIKEQSSIEDQVETNSNVKNTNSAVTTKLIAVFPTTSDELDFEEIEHAASSLANDDDSLDCLSGTSKIIPNLELHENIDFTPLLRIEAEPKIVDKENKITSDIEPIFVEFKLETREIDDTDVKELC